MAQSITVHSRRIRKQVPIEVIVTRATFRSVSYIALDKSFSGTLSQWQFLQDFQPVRSGRRRDTDECSCNFCRKSA
jgi:hypothetical protein